MWGLESEVLTSPCHLSVLFASFEKDGMLCRTQIECNVSWWNHVIHYLLSLARGSVIIGCVNWNTASLTNILSCIEIMSNCLMTDANVYRSGCTKCSSQLKLSGHFVLWSDLLTDWLSNWLNVCNLKCKIKKVREALNHKMWDTFFKPTSCDDASSSVGRF